MTLWEVNLLRRSGGDCFEEKDRKEGQDGFEESPEEKGKEIISNTKPSYYEQGFLCILN